ncbi:sensor histidine kinase [Tsukamurella asaccharolytica]|uniref:histidine kinase n=1 Tax=Tsukamurella asaccharolytica TaxID=2592067 RepID=A0A5C5RCV9_9ACTN|nr:sensor histidine kinase [Tsukamurella asaccharolytica]TWS20879.1 sensor histidine kinase [Tsukamurella asaccharolytica]
MSLRSSLLRRADPLVAAAVWALGVATLLGHPTTPSDRLVVAGFGLLCSLPLAWRRRFPVTGLLVIGLLGFAGQVTPIAALLEGPFVLAFAVAIGTVAAGERPWRAAAWVVVAAAPAFVTAGWLLDHEPGGVIATAAWLALAFAIGRAVGFRRSLFLARAAAERAEQRQAIERRIADERAAMARELHDLIAQSVEAVSMQAGIGLHLFDSRPDEAKAALQRIHTTSRGASREIRELLGLLRGTEIEPGRVPSLEDLPGLVHASGIDGPPATFAVSGAPGSCDPLTGRTLYRVAQEALINARRHAHAGSVRVELDWQADRLRLSVTDDGTGPPPGDLVEGYGVRGMRERLALVGGSLRWGPAPGGGFHVIAEVPREDRACSPS